MDEREKIKLQRDYEHGHDLARGEMAFEHAALRPLFLLNGGALVVFLAFYGSIMTATRNVAGFNGHLAIWAMGVWCTGLVSAALAGICGYFSQRHFRGAADRRMEAIEFLASGRRMRVRDCVRKRRKYHKLGKRCRRLVLGVGGLSLVAFIGGDWTGRLGYSV